MGDEPPEQEALLPGMIGEPEPATPTEEDLAAAAAEVRCLRTTQVTQLPDWQCQWQGWLSAIN